MFEAVTAWDNLWLAYRKAARGKRRRASAAAFEHQVADRLITLQDDLRREGVSPGRVPPLLHSRAEAAQDQRRTLSRPRGASCAVQPHRARLRRAASSSTATPTAPVRAPTAPWTGSRHWARRYRYVLRADVVQHFPSLDHAILSAKLARVIRRRGCPMAGRRHSRQRRGRAGGRVQDEVLRGRRPARRLPSARVAHR